MTTALQPISSEAFEPILTMLRDLEGEDAQDLVTSDAAAGEEFDVDAQWRDWTRTGPVRIEQLIDNGEHTEALLEWTDVQERLPCLDEPERDSLSQQLENLKGKTNVGTQTTEKSELIEAGEGAQLTIDTDVNGVT